MSDNPALEGIAKKTDSKDMLEFLYENTDDLLLWGSEEVIRAWINLREKAVKQTQENTEEKFDHVEMMFDIEKLFYAIRQDLGYKDKNLEKGDLLRFFVNDIDDYL
ncbi:MAG: hypothetical protein ACOCRX_12520 [Candidatus Woesearchaeota archaeon]